MNLCHTLGPISILSPLTCGTSLTDQRLSPLASQMARHRRRRPQAAAMKWPPRTAHRPTPCRSGGQQVSTTCLPDRHVISVKRMHEGPRAPPAASTLRAADAYAGTLYLHVRHRRHLLNGYVRSEERQRWQESGRRGLSDLLFHY
jgi:hypothetical protein